MIYGTSPLVEPLGLQWTVAVATVDADLKAQRHARPGHDVGLLHARRSITTIAKELGIGIGTVHNYLAEAKQEANKRAGDLGEQIRAQEDIRLLDIIDKSMAIVDALSGQTDKHGVPIDHKAVTALGTALRASESRRRLYGVDIRTPVTLPPFDTMTEEEARAILVETGCTCGDV